MGQAPGSRACLTSSLSPDAITTQSRRQWRRQRSSLRLLWWDGMPTSISTRARICRSRCRRQQRSLDHMSCTCLLVLTDPLGNPPRVSRNSHYLPITSLPPILEWLHSIDSARCSTPLLTREPSSQYLQTQSRLPRHCQVRPSARGRSRGTLRLLTYVSQLCSSLHIFRHGICIA